MSVFLCFGRVPQLPHQGRVRRHRHGAGPSRLFPLHKVHPVGPIVHRQHIPRHLAGYTYQISRQKQLQQLAAHEQAATGACGGPHALLVHSVVCRRARSRMLALQPRESAGGDGARQSECERAHTPVCTTPNTGPGIFSTRRKESPRARHRIRFKVFRVLDLDLTEGFQMGEGAKAFGE